MTVHLVCITCGGPRRHALLSQFERDANKWSLNIAQKAFGDETPPVLDG